MSRIISYLKDTRAELKNANWPSSSQTMAYTGLVIGISLVVALYLAIFDTAALVALETIL